MMRALIIEDDPALQIFYRRVLEKANYTVEIANNGRQGLDALQSLNLPHLILLDMRLPDTNGLEVLKFIASQEHLQSIHIVVASAGSEFEKHVQQIPSVQFLLKPVRPAQIMEIAAQQAQRLKT